MKSIFPHWVLPLLLGFLGGVTVASLSTNLDRPQQRKLNDTSYDLTRFKNSFVPVEPISAWAKRALVYVPAYAGVRLGSGKGELQLAVTLSIRNSSPTLQLNIARIDYHGTAGELIESYLQSHVALKPLSTVEVFIEASDMRAGPGGHFIVEWGNSSEASEPIIEAIMIGTVGTNSYSFVSPGRNVSPVKP